jgi:acetylornithine deacetylase/succinyl-diaminopimelate desuccinylase-like protein
LCAQLLYEAEKEVTSLLSDLIRINTTNPPGNETVAAQFLAETLGNESLKCEVIESSPGRGNVITSIKGTGKKPNLLLLSHLDVVPAIEKEWSVNPFSGLVKDGFVWGRGALDMKSFVAIEALVMKLLARNEVKPKGDIIFAATADEERGGNAGVGWLIQNHPEKIRADYVINEGGGESFPINGKHIFTVQTAEKGVNWLRIKAKGSPGHGSIPGIADNAVLRMAEVARKLGNHKPKIMLVDSVKQFLKGVAEENTVLGNLLNIILNNPATADKILDEMAKKEKTIAEILRAMLRMTIAPTMIKGGIKENIIPSESEGVFDCRILPGQTKDDLLNEIKTVMADVDLSKLSFEFIQSDAPSESRSDTPLYEIIEKTLKEFEPGCSVVPYMVTGGTDSRFLRNVGSICYGFHPLKMDMPLDEFWKLIHGIDERISIQNLIFGVSVIYQVVEKFMT